MLALCVISPGRWSRRVSIPAISDALSGMPNDVMQIFSPSGEGRDRPF
ncbi:hypothetical protein SAMN04490180_0730 [Pseudomonas brassicacearum]|nr:hypothetical protein SAMN04490180_0730 [Pseudomonas brassicacearum]